MGGDVHKRRTARPVSSPVSTQNIRDQFMSYHRTFGPRIAGSCLASLPELAAVASFMTTYAIAKGFNSFVLETIDHISQGSFNQAQENV